MKKLLLSLSICLAINCLAQTKLYKTYQDYLNDRGRDVGMCKVSIQHAFNNFNIYPLSGEKMHIGKQWGMLLNGDVLYRLTKHRVPFRVLIKGTLCFYGNYTCQIGMNGSITQWSSNWGFMISKGINGKLLYATNSNFKKLIKDDPELLKAWKNIPKTVGALPMDEMMQITIRYNEKHK
jgi:hypothetical protein